MPQHDLASVERTSIRIAAVAAVAWMLSGCASPLERDEEQRLRDALLESHRRQLASIAPGEAIEVTRPASDVESQLTDERRAELDRISGPRAYSELPPDLFGQDLEGSDRVQAVELSLQEAIEMAVRHNLDLKAARLGPAIAEQRVLAAESAFDSVFFTDVEWSKLDTPRPAGGVFGGDEQSETLQATAGLRKGLYSGGTLSLETAIARLEDNPSQFNEPSYYDADVLVSLTQPLLRGFGSDVARADIFLAENARLAETQRLRQRLLELALETETAYWDLVLARQQVLIQWRLLQRTIDDRDRLLGRAEFDVSPVQITEANSFVELRRAEVIRARAAMREASDRLKRLMNSPDLPIASETLLLPVDEPVEAAIRFNLLESVTAALRNRPELQEALLNISDASIRQRVADNARLPLLDLSAAVGLNGIDTDEAGDAYGRLAEADYIDYLLAGQFEVPLGNRGPQAQYRAARLEREQAVLAYRALAEDRVLAVKNALRQVLTSYQLIGATRAARRAAADSLRAIEEQEAAGVALTPEFLLDLKLQTQERLANAEIQEIDALTNYNAAIAAYYEAVGTLLQRNGIQFRESE